MSMPIVQPMSIPTKGKNPMQRAKAWAAPRKWRMVEDWDFTFPGGGDGVIPKGFIFDGASVPRPLWWLLAPTGLLLMPAIVHDYAYKHDSVLMRISLEKRHIHKGKGRKYWDNIFLKMCNDINGIKTLNIMAWAALRLGGWAAWRSHRK